MDLDLIRQLAVPNDTKILLAVIDGLGGLPHAQTRRSELETAHTPHLDRLAADSSCGLTVPVARGVTPGSGPGHLALFGYDPLRYTVGRGVLEGLGIDFDLQPDDVAARGNFCTLDAEGRIVDRRAGRIASEQSAALCKSLQEITLTGAQLFVEPVREHRFLLVLRPEKSTKLSGLLADTDPQREGAAPLEPRALAPEANATAEIVGRFVAAARERLNGQQPANGVTLRGFAQRPELPSMPEAFRLRAGAVAGYPMYRGLAKLVGMTVLSTGTSFDDEIETLRQHWDEFDFLFVHYKAADAAGEDGDFKAKVAALEAFDASVPRLRDLGADVLLVAGDHSTPAVLAGHSWHPVPFLLHSTWARPDNTTAFNEQACLLGSLGTFPAVEALPLAMAHARRFAKYGA
ncbi:MAG: 2,3-bisphosphoglycerate-independent phosphoglycerate mutase [Chloroflexi bacterium]|nr:2,3-bisphosphoglycerate-independent phosphoglycerate mutase [Chloroflexota bacterium]